MRDVNVYSGLILFGFVWSLCINSFFMHPPPLGGADVYVFYSVFFPSATKYETTVLGNG